MRYTIKAQIENPQMIAEIANLPFYPSRLIVENLCSEYANYNICTISAAIVKRGKKTVNYIDF